MIAVDRVRPAAKANGAVTADRASQNGSADRADHAVTVGKTARNAMNAGDRAVMTVADSVTADRASRYSRCRKSLSRLFPMNAESNPWLARSR